MWWFLCIVIVSILIWILGSITEYINEEYSKSFGSVSIEDRYHIKGIKDPFNVSNEQICVIIGKEKSSEDGKNYVSYYWKHVKYSCEWNKFRKKWIYINRNSHLYNIKLEEN